MRHLLAYTAATFFPRLGAFLAIFVFSRLLSIQDFGFYVLAIAVGEFCDYATSTWFRIGFLRLYHPGNLESDKSRPKITPILRAYVACSLAGVLLVWPIAVALTHSHWLAFAAVTSLYVLGNGTVQAALSTLRGEGRSRDYALIELIRPVGSLIIGYATARWYAASFFPVALAVFGCNAGAGSAILAIVWWSRRGKMGADRLGELVSISWPFAISGLIIATINASDSYQLQWWLGSGAVAIYAAANTLGRQPFSVLFRAVNLGSFTELMKTFDLNGARAAAELLGEQMAFMLAIGLPTAVGATMLSSQLVHAMFDHRYWSAAPHLVPLLAFTGLLAGLKSTGFDQVFYMTRRTDIQIYSLLPSLVIGLGASAVLINLIGLSGAAYGVLIGYVLSVVISGYLAHRLIPSHLPWIDLAKIAAATMIMASSLYFTSNLVTSALLDLILSTAVGFAVYSAILLAINPLRIRDRALFLLAVA